MSYHLRKSLGFIFFPFLGILISFIAENSVAEPMVEAEMYRLRQSVQALNRVREQASQELDKASTSGRFSVQEQHDYQTFIAFLGGRVGEYCRTLYLAGGQQAVAGLTCPGGGEAGLSTLTTPASAVKTTDEKIEALDATFTDLLGDFDEMLLKEQDRIAAHQPRQRESGESGGSGGVGGNGGSSGQGGEGTGSAGEGGQDAQGKEAGEAVAQGSISVGGTPGSGDGAKGGSGGQSSASSGASGQGALDIDEDIVARQLREAAEKETDPELKEKLWEEYKKYKGGK